MLCKLLKTSLIIWFSSDTIISFSSLLLIRLMVLSVSDSIDFRRAWAMLVSVRWVTVNSILALDG